jgi:4-alpha-glucanotransferase
MEKRLSPKRLTGTFIPVGALRGSGSMGVGEFLDLPEFAILCKKMGLGLIQLLPVNDSGYESSPYFSLTANALHPMYIRIEALEEYKNPADSEVFKTVTEKIAQAGQAFGDKTRIPFYHILRAKMEILHDLFASNKAAITQKAAKGGALARWIEENPWVKEYAVYRRLKEANGEKSWKEWKEYRNVTAEDITALWNNVTLQEEHLFWVWLQEALDTQFRTAAEAVAKEGILIEGDLPILMNEDSCDVWAHPELFIQELSAGAPPDMYSPAGQNWGFPIYNWEAQEKDDYAWWRQRLAVAGRYYQAYRIDHVLGFFRIWASTRNDYSAVLGRFIPSAPVTVKDLKNLGFDTQRIRWVSQPHIPTGEVWEALRNNWNGPQKETEIAAAAEKIFSRALTQIGNEELWLFKKKIQGEKDITSLGLHPAGSEFLIKAWQNRMMLEYQKGKFFPTWQYKSTRAYFSLSQEEKNNLEIMLDKHNKKSEKIWKAQGMKTLSVLCRSSHMLPCAEDLGAVPDCVPVVLSKLKIFSLRVVRWCRLWDTDGRPYIPFDKYPELSVCTASVHDSSTLREWWEQEAEQDACAAFLGYPSLSKVYNPGTAKAILHKIATAKSRFRVFQIQDLLHLSPKWYADDPASERINVPGTINEFNWTYRLPASIEEIGKDKDLIKAVAELTKIKPAIIEKKPE